MNTSGTGAYEKLLQTGLAPNVAQELDNLITEGYFPPEGFQEKTAAVFRGIDYQSLSEIILTYKSSDFTNVADFDQRLIDVAYSVIPMPPIKSEPAFPQRPFPPAGNRGRGAGAPPPAREMREEKGLGPRKTGNVSERMQRILDRTNYKYEVTSGQRSYGPGPGYEDFKPPRNCQCYFGKIPMEWFLEDLIEIFEKVGTIWHMRLMMNQETGKNHTYGFVTYMDPETAKRCVEQCDGLDCLMPGTNRTRKMTVKISEPNRRLFVGPIPKVKSKEDIWAAFSTIVDGIEDVIVQEPAEPGGNHKNKGFCFLDFTEHKLAAQAKKRLDPGTIPIKDWRNLTGYGAAWADPLDEPDEEIMSKIKNVYITKLTDSVTEADLKERFSQYGTIERVKKVSNYAFVNFTERDEAMRAIECENGQRIKDSVMKVQLAKPVPPDSKNRLQQMRDKQTPRPGGGPGSSRGGFGGDRGGRDRSKGYPSDYGYADDYGYDQYSYDSYGYSSGYDRGYDSYGGPESRPGERYPPFGYRPDPYASRMPPTGRGGYPPRDGPPMPPRPRDGFGAPPRDSFGPPRGGFGGARDSFGPPPFGDYGDKRPFGNRGGPPPKRGRGGY